MIETFGRHRSAFRQKAALLNPAILHFLAKRQRAGAVQDASRILIIIASRTAFWSAAPMHRGRFGCGVRVAQLVFDCENDNEDDNDRKKAVL
jgi:hypothetical protein